MRSGKTALRWIVLHSLLAGMPAVASAAAPIDADGWITHPGAAQISPVVLHFRREITFDRVPGTFPVSITADNRFILYVNGRRVASGPSRGTVARWREARVDLAPALRSGRNVIAAVVWNFGESAPLAQTSVATGFRLSGESIATGAPGWRVRIDAGHSAVKGNQLAPQYYVASTPEIIDASKADWDWQGSAESGPGWQDAIPAPAAAARTLIADPLPQQVFAPAGPGEVVRSDVAGAAKLFPRTRSPFQRIRNIKLLLRRPAMISGYPELEVSGGEGAVIKLT